MGQLRLVHELVDLYDRQRERAHDGYLCRGRLGPAPGELRGRLLPIDHLRDLRGEEQLRLVRRFRREPALSARRFPEPLRRALF